MNACLWCGNPFEKRSKGDCRVSVHSNVLGKSAANVLASCIKKIGEKKGFVCQKCFHAIHCIVKSEKKLTDRHEQKLVNISLCCFYVLCCC